MKKVEIPRTSGTIALRSSVTKNEAINSWV